MKETTCTIITLLLCLHLNAQTDNRDIQLDLAEGDNHVLWLPNKRTLTAPISASYNSKELYIVHHLDDDEIIITITDSDRLLVFAAQYSADFSNQIIIPISHLINGTYLLTIRCNDTEYIGTFGYTY